MSSSCFHPIPTRNGLLFPCGKCPACLSQRKEELAQRLYIEACSSRCAYFVTLTYEDNELVYCDSDIPTFDKEQVRIFIRSLRDFLRSKKISLRYFLTSEYGDKSLRPHYHAIIYFSEFLSLQQVYELISKKWSFGLVYISSIGRGCLKYVSKYCLKDDGTENLDRKNPYKPFRLFSRRPGIGCTDESVFWYYNLWSLHQNYFDPDQFEFAKRGAQFIPKVPRTVRNHFDDVTKQKLSAVGWSKFYQMQEQLGINLRDKNLNNWDGFINNVPNKQRDFVVKEKIRKLRQLKKNCI